MKGTGTLRFRLHSTIDAISREDWERLFGSTGPEGWGYHKAFEASGIAGFRLGYLAAEKAGRPCAVLPFFVTDFSFAVLIRDGLQKTILALQKAFPSFLKMRLLFIGLPTAEEFYLGVENGLPLAEVIKPALQEFSLLMRREKIGAILFYNLSPANAELAACLKKLGFAAMKNYPNTQISLTADSFEKYIESLSANARKDFRRKLRNGSRQAEIKAQLATDIRGCAQEIYRLYKDNYADSEIHFEELTPEFFLNISRFMPEEAKFFVFSADGKIVAFNLCLIKGDTCIDKFVGFDRGLSRKLHLYHATLAHNLRWCLRNNIRFYQMGITDYHPKLRLGARLVPLTVYFHLRNPVLHFFSPLTARIITPYNFDPDLKKIRL
jgi:predicted N-acyltransferase